MAYWGEVVRRAWREAAKTVKLDSRKLLMVLVLGQIVIGLIIYLALGPEKLPENVLARVATIAAPLLLFVPFFVCEMFSTQAKMYAEQAADLARFRAENEAAAPMKGAAQANTVVHALKIEFGAGGEFEDNSVRPGGKRIRTVKVALRNVGDGPLRECSLRIVRVAPMMPEGSIQLPLVLRSVINLWRGELSFVEVAEYVESDPDEDYPWPISLCKAYLGGIGTSRRADLPIDMQRREYEITLEATAPDSKEVRVYGRLFVDKQNRMRLEPI